MLSLQGAEPLESLVSFLGFGVNARHVPAEIYLALRVA
jgi:hypothetical protein